MTGNFHHHENGRIRYTWGEDAGRARNRLAPFLYVEPQRPLVCWLVLCICLFSSTAVFADIYVPPSVSPGQSYQLVFSTPGWGGVLGIDGEHGDLSYYDAYVNSEAASSPMTSGVVWHAIVATVNNPYVTLNAPVSCPVYNMDGDLVAGGYTQFWSSGHEAQMGITQYGGTSHTATYIWTGFYEDGTPALTLGSSLYEHKATNGGAGSTSYWAGVSLEDESALYSVYALSDPIQAPASTVPEPSSLVMFGGLFGSAGVLAWRRQRTTKGRCVGG